LQSDQGPYRFPHRQRNIGHEQQPMGCHHERR
jgi:hypothetical protein